MNNFNNLILVKGQDKTDKIIRYSHQTNYVLITYSNSLSPYSYNSRNIAIYSNPQELNPLVYRITKDGKILADVVRIQQFDQHFRVFYSSGRYNTFSKHSVSLISSSLSEPTINDRFNYFRKLSHVDTLLGNDNRSILGKRYDKISFVREDCILSDYLRGVINVNNRSNEQTLYYPFGFNSSQKNAVDNALNNRISVIEGPPGTGKTQTILNIIANIVMSGQSVAVVSSNNAATENIEEKLKKYSVDFISAFLGSAANKESFLLKQKEIPNLITWKLDSDETHKILTSISALFKTLTEKLKKKNELSILKQKLDSILLEQKHFLMYYTETNVSDIDFKSIRNLKSNTILKLMAQYELRQKGENSSPTLFWSRISDFFRFGIFNYEFYHNGLDRIVAVCQKKFYEKLLNEIQNQITVLECELNNFDFDQKMSIYSELSMKLFRHYLSQKYENQNRSTYSNQDLWNNSEKFIKDYPVILSTTHSLRSSLSDQHVYDYVIIDEASQVNITTGALAFSCAKRAVIVGDLKQLPNVVDSEMKRRTDGIYNQYNLPEAYRYSDHSLLLSVTELFSNIPRAMLREHYRCSPSIINFCNQKYYNNQLIILSQVNADKIPMIVYKSTPGNHARDKHNQRQIDIICKEVIPQQNLDINTPTIGIVTPYRNQADALQKVFLGTKVKADTVDKFQGQERDIIILSTVDNDISDFADDDNRLNVAVSRAVKQLIVVINGNPSTRNTGIGDLVNYIQYNNMDIINSEVYSVFDLLYKQYGLMRRSLLSKYKRVSEYDSENLMYTVIQDLLKRNAYNQYDVVQHVPLRMILRDLSKLNSDRETEFVMNNNTHVDFLIYNKLSHQPVVIIEVDGYRYHKDGTPQAERDRLKNDICARYNIPLERFQTTGSSEYDRLVTILNKISIK